jgi:hypothetical protein
MCLDPTTIIVPINHRLDYHTNLLLHHHHERGAEHSPRELRSDPLIQPPNSPGIQLLGNHLRYRRLLVSLGIPLRALQHDLGSKVRVREHRCNDPRDHSKKERLGRRERI